MRAWTARPGIRVRQCSVSGRGIVSLERFRDLRADTIGRPPASSATEYPPPVPAPAGLRRNTRGRWGTSAARRRRGDTPRIGTIRSSPFSIVTRRSVPLSIPSARRNSAGPVIRPPRDYRTILDRLVIRAAPHKSHVRMRRLSSPSSDRLRPWTTDSVVSALIAPDQIAPFRHMASTVQYPVHRLRNPSAQ